MLKKQNELHKTHRKKTGTHRTLYHNSNRDTTINSMTDCIDKNAHIEEKMK